MNDLVEQIESIEELKAVLVSEDLANKNVLWYIQNCEIKSIFNSLIMD